MDIIPAIDLLGGVCVRLRQGDYDRVTRFSDDPVSQGLIWQDQGASRLHLVDLDAARSGEPVNDDVIAALASRLRIPIQVGGGVRSAERVVQLLDRGIDRVILGTVAIENPDLVRDLASRYPGSVVVGIDARDGRVATRGWREESSVRAVDLAARYESSDVAAIVSTDIGSDGMLAGPNLEALRTMALATRIPVLASGGVADLTDVLSLLALEPLGVAGVIVGRALYDGTLDLAEAVAAVGEGRLQDPDTLPLA
jgi:phosphoribosylformimino-5-aminoimidazole carboxamide ribotide isomerase